MDDAAENSVGVSPGNVARLVDRLVQWYERWRPPPE